MNSLVENVDARRCLTSVGGGYTVMQSTNGSNLVGSNR